MKILGFVAAAFVGFLSAPTAANAYVQQPVTPPALELVSASDLVQRWDDRRDYRRGYDRRDYRRHRGWRNNRWRWRTRCHNQWRDGRRERICRRIRYR